MRNPLNVITGNAELVRETGDLAHLEPIERAADRVNRLTLDLLTLARQGQTVNEREPVRLADLVADAWTVAGCESARLTVDERLSKAPTVWRVRRRSGSSPAATGELTRERDRTRRTRRNDRDRPAVRRERLLCRRRWPGDSSSQARSGVRSRLHDESERDRARTDDRRDRRRRSRLAVDSR
ncbi:hypothetical protein BRD01_09025 [Halobacteriales archaeon QS_8_65_32]|nr:MAG: hypothetical protein BRD01_09025 [Halobacteriales archaeon QS_8_65_32]